MAANQAILTKKVDRLLKNCLTGIIMFQPKILANSVLSCPETPQKNSCYALINKASICFAYNYQKSQDRKVMKSAEFKVGKDVGCFRPFLLLTSSYWYLKVWCFKAKNCFPLKICSVSQLWIVCTYDNSQNPVDVKEWVDETAGSTSHAAKSK